MKWYKWSQQWLYSLHWEKAEKEHSDVTQWLGVKSLLCSVIPVMLHGCSPCLIMLPLYCLRLVWSCLTQHVCKKLRNATWMSWKPSYRFCGLRHFVGLAHRYTWAAITTWVCWRTPGAGIQSSLTREMTSSYDRAILDRRSWLRLYGEWNEEGEEAFGTDNCRDLRDLTGHPFRHAHYFEKSALIEQQSGHATDIYKVL